MSLKIFNKNLAANYCPLTIYKKTSQQNISFKGTSDIFVPNSQKPSFKSSDPNQETVDWYNTNAENYFNETKNFSMKKEYPPFLEYIPKGGKILDAGCGSGRDTKEFKDMGYKVTAFDASEELAKKASKHTGLNVEATTFEKFKSDDKFDGIWACTSLLHVSKKSKPILVDKNRERERERERHSLSLF